jgi:hypothetical protein
MPEPARERLFPHRTRISDCGTESSEPPSIVRTGRLRVDERDEA